MPREHKKLLTDDKAAQKALEDVPELTREFYVPYFDICGDNPGSFVGLVCTCCNFWRDFHDDECPIFRLEKSTWKESKRWPR